MARRRTDRHLVFLFGSPAEAEAIRRLMALEGTTSAADLVRRALWSLADEQGIELPPDVFKERGRRLRELE